MRQVRLMWVNARHRACITDARGTTEGAMNMDTRTGLQLIFIAAFVS
jgi:hypothetical protein